MEWNEPMEWNRVSGIEWDGAERKAIARSDKE